MEQQQPPSSCSEPQQRSRREPERAAELEGLAAVPGRAEPALVRAAGGRGSAVGVQVLAELVQEHAARAQAAVQELLEAGLERAAQAPAMGQAEPPSVAAVELETKVVLGREARRMSVAEPRIATVPARTVLAAPVRRVNVAIAVTRMPVNSVAARVAAQELASGASAAMNVASLVPVGNAEASEAVNGAAVAKHGVL